MTEPRKHDKPKDGESLIPAGTLAGLYPQESSDEAPVPAALAGRVAVLENALAGLVRTCAEQQSRLEGLARQVRAPSVPSPVAPAGLVPVSVMPAIATALQDLIAFMQTNPKFAYDVRLGFRRMEKVRGGPLTKLHEAIMGTAVADG